MHIPVLQREVIEYLQPKSNENFIDCTIGEGGHALAILEKNGPNGKILGIDWSPEIIKNLEFRIKNLGLENRIVLVCDNFSNLKNIVRKLNFKPVSGILFDLGLSSWHLEESKMGFSFQRDEPLDMRYNVRAQNFPKESLRPPTGQANLKTQNLTAERIVNEWSEAEIRQILNEYGQERFADRIAKKITEERKARPIKSTFDLIEIIKKATPRRYQQTRIHAATRTFQALRIAVNDELGNLKKVLPQTIDILESGGRLVVISFHSLEDRVVKSFFKENLKSQLEKNSLARKKGCLKILTKKPVRPKKEEITLNPRSRSARLRAVTKI